MITLCIYQMSYTIPSAVKELLSCHSIASVSSSSSSSSSRIAKHFFSRRKSRGKATGVQFLSPKKKTVDVNEAEKVESDEDEERRMVCEDELEKEDRIGDRIDKTTKEKLQNTILSEESKTDFRAVRKSESARHMEGVNTDREGHRLWWTPIEPETSCSRTVPVDKLCLRTSKWGMKVHQLPCTNQLSTTRQLPATSIERPSTGSFNIYYFLI